MPYAIQSLLGLQGLIIVSVVHHFQLVYLYVLVRRKTGTCSHCGKLSRYLHGYRPPQMVKHILVGGSQLYLVLHKRRFFCKQCNQAFVESIPGLDKWSRHTQYLGDEILLRLKETSFAAITRTTSLTYREQAKTLLAKVNPSIPKWEEIKEPFVLGLDEQSFSGRDMLATVTDITHHKLLCVLNDDHKPTLTAFFTSIPPEKRSLIKAMCTDMRVSYDVALKNHPQFKHVPLVIDKYHLISDANKRINEERVIIQSVVLEHKQRIPKTLLLKGFDVCPKGERSL